MRNKKSAELFKKTIKIIPLGTQTFSKSHLLYYKGDIPHFIEKGEGCFVWDIDGNKYIDYVSGLSALVLGYNCKEVNDAIQKQLKNGILFSLASPLEYELSKKLTEIIPCAEMVRFGKSGTDATSSAIRLARYVTKREKVAVCGYHGRQDRYIGSTTRNGGVPKCVQNLTLKFEYNNISSLEKIFSQNPKEIAAIIMEPMTTEEPKDNFLQKVKDICHKHGALFILDETVTGFKLSIGGAQKHFGVTPDLAAFGKSMGNGMPISALVGKREYMQKVEEIFFSGTYLGESLSMAAAIATINFMQKNKVQEKIYKIGGMFIKGLRTLIKKHGLDQCISIAGYNNQSVCLFQDYKGIKAIQIKSYLQKELLEKGILWIGNLNMNYAHTENIIRKSLVIFDSCLGILQKKISNKTILKEIKGKEINDIFRIR